MNKENISDIISGIDDKFIEEACHINRKKKTSVYKYTGVAACLAAVILSGVLIFGDTFSVPPVSSETTSGELVNEAGNGDKGFPETVTNAAIYNEDDIRTELSGEIEMQIVPQWEDLAVPMKYTEAKLNDITYSTQCTEISKENVLGFLGTSEMQGYDIYTDTTYTVNAELFSIKHISSDCAVAVRIDNSEKYYVYVNVWYEPDNLGDFINDLDLKNIVSFGKAYIDIYKYDTLSTSHTQIIYADFDDNVIWDLLRDSADAKNVEYNHPYERIGIETNIPLLGYENISFCITPDGYIITNILSTQKCFYIGEDKFDKFDTYLKNNVPSKQIDNSYELAPDGAIPGKGEIAEEVTSPGYNPETDSAIPDYYVPGASTPPYIPDDSIVVETTKIATE